jgi:hypothetical protein
MYYVFKTKHPGNSIALCNWYRITSCLGCFERNHHSPTLAPTETAVQVSVELSTVRLTDSSRKNHMIVNGKKLCENMTNTRIGPKALNEPKQKKDSD